MVFTGKTATPEFGLPCYTETLVGPPARTPWDLERSAGGSSGGAAAAVAAGLAPVAHGSDGGGSIRIPASVCGLVGLKPSRGRISNGPLRDPVGELPTQGPLARTVADAAALLDAMAGPWPGDPYPAPPLPPGEAFLDARRPRPGAAGDRPLPDPGAGRHRGPPRLRRRVRRGHASCWSSLGHEVVEVGPPFTHDVVPQFEALWSVLALLTPVAPDDEASTAAAHPVAARARGAGQRDPAGRGGLPVPAAVPGRHPGHRALRRGAGADAGATASARRWPARRRRPWRDFDNQKRFSPFTAVYNVTGQPAVSLPLHWTADGLPIGVMLAGRPYGEAALIELAAQLEAARPWAHRKPALW